MFQNLVSVIYLSSQSYFVLLPHRNNLPPPKMLCLILLVSADFIGKNQWSAVDALGLHSAACDEFCRSFMCVLEDLEEEQEKRRSSEMVRLCVHHSQAYSPESFSSLLGMSDWSFLCVILFITLCLASVCVV